MLSASTGIELASLRRSVTPAPSSTNAAHDTHPMKDVSFLDFRKTDPIRLRSQPTHREGTDTFLMCLHSSPQRYACLLYTSDAADDLLCVDLGGRRIIKNKKTTKNHAH